MTLALALVITSLPSAEVLQRFAPAEITRSPVEGTALIKVLAQRGRGGRWLEHDGRMTSISPEGAAELSPVSTREQAERYVALFESGTVVDRSHAQRLVPKLPAEVKGSLVVERFVARTLETGGAELVQVVLRFSATGAAREEQRLVTVAGSAQSAAPASASSDAPAALKKFWDAVNAP